MQPAQGPQQEPDDNPGGSEPRSPRPAGARPRGARGEGPKATGRTPGRGKPPRGGPGRTGAGRTAAGSGRPAQRPGTVGNEPAESYPSVAPEVTGKELDPQVRAELAGLGRDLATRVARHLVMVGTLLDEDPDGAWEHAVAAKRLAARIAVVREATGLAAYGTGRYKLALAELRTARRLTGSPVHLPVMADCERGMGRPERALALATSAEVTELDREGQVEMLIVAAGARTDLGQLDAAVVTLQVPWLRADRGDSWLARLRSAYADALTAVGREAEGRRWLERAAAADPEGFTGAAERLAELDGVIFLGEDDGPPGTGTRAARVDPAGSTGTGQAAQDSADRGPVDDGPTDAERIGTDGHGRR